MTVLVQNLLEQLQTELQRQQLWSNQPPDVAAMQSELPFCYDTLALEQWLQFVFLPRMQALLDAGQTLPQNVAILPVAQLAFGEHSTAGKALLPIIARIDATLSRTI